MKSRALVLITLGLLAGCSKKPPILVDAKICHELNAKELCSAHEEVLPTGTNVIYYNVGATGELEGLEVQTQWLLNGREIGKKKDPLKLGSSSVGFFGNLSNEKGFARGKYTFIAKLIKRADSQYSHEEVIRTNFDIE